VDDRPDLRRRVRARIDELPVFPAVAVRVLAIVRDPKHSTLDVAKCVEADPALATRVLALANSALFSPRRPIRTLTHATMFIGERALTGAVVAAAIERFYGRGSPQAAQHEPIWRHSLAVGAIARELARRVGLDAERAMALGLIHDVGLLHLRVEADALGDEIRAAREMGLPQRAAEIATFGADHALLGGAILASLGLPEDLADGVTEHHDPPDDAPASEEDCLHVADAIASAAEIAPDEELDPEPPRDAVLYRLALGSVDLENEVAKVPEMVDALERSLGL